MTLRDRLLFQHPELAGTTDGKIVGCPSEYDFLNSKEHYNSCVPTQNDVRDCAACWDREYVSPVGTAYYVGDKVQVRKDLNTADHYPMFDSIYAANCVKTMLSLCDCVVTISGATKKGYIVRSESLGELPFVWTDMMFCDLSTGYIFKHQVGDTVRIRNNLVKGACYSMRNLDSFAKFTKEMLTMRGNTVTIATVSEAGYTIESDNVCLQDCIWTDDMFEDEFTREVINMKGIYNVGDYVQVRNDLVVGERYAMHNDQHIDSEVSEAMAKYSGKKVTIAGIEGDRYIIAQDGFVLSGYWTDDMFSGNCIFTDHVKSCREAAATQLCENLVPRLQELADKEEAEAARRLPVIKDSGDRREFATGAVRDMAEGKGRMDLLPWDAIMEVSKHCENGAKKYGEHNVDKGIPTHSLCDSAARHLAKYLAGWDDEPHLLAAAWNLLWAVEMTINHPEIVDTPWSQEGR